MHALSCAFFALALPAQVPVPAPQWLTDLQKVQQEMYQAPLGSLEGKAEQAWRAALQTPQHPRFPMAAQMTASFYQSQGYDLKAEQVLRQALAVVPEGVDPWTRRNLTLELARHFESTQQLVKALAIQEDMAREPPRPGVGGYTAPSYDAAALANLLERMGEIEKAEAVWKEVAAQRATESAQRTAASVQGETELANLYARHGRAAEGEQIYEEAFAEAAQSNSPYEWNGVADGYTGFLYQQSRFDEAVDLTRQSIARLEGLSDPRAAEMLPYKREQLANLLVQAGRPDEALAVQKQTVEAAEARNPGGPEYTQALASLAQTLINQNRLDEAEKAVAQMRAAGAADSRNARFHESMAVQMLARIRDMQKRPEEARQLRANMGVPDLTAGHQATTVHDLVGPAQQMAIQGNIDGAIAAADRAVALAAERLRTNPQEVSALMNLANTLMSKQKKEQARRIAFEALRSLEQAPDHPRVADALGSVVSTMASLGMTAEAERAIERQEKILISAKGAESLSLNSIGYGRIALMQRDSNWAGVIDERKRMLARTEKATGSKSRESVYAMREVAWAYPSIDNWPEEERVLATLHERTVSLLGQSSLEHAQLLQHMANRASENRQFDQALNWMDQAIEVTRALPEASMHLAGMTQNRARLAKAKDAPPGVPANRGGKWFDTGRFQRTDGTRLGNVPAGAVTVDGPVVIRKVIPNAPDAVPPPAPPPAPTKP